MNNNSDNSNENSVVNQFNIDLCQAMVAANIPWRSLDNPILNNFLCKYMNRRIPNQSTIRKNYLDVCYKDVIKECQDYVGDNYIWIFVDETTDSARRNIANLIVGKLTEDEASKSYLIACKQLEQTNHAIIARFANSALKIVLPNVNEEKDILIVTDAAAYMIKAAEHLKIFYPNLLHLTCTVHGLHRIAELIRNEFPRVNSLISTIKNFFLKAPRRIELYKNLLQGVPLPPEPVLTRWGTWLQEALFYANHLEDIKRVVDILNPEDAEAIRSAQEIMNVTELECDLVFIKTHFKEFPQILTTLETRCMSLTDSMELVNNYMKQLKNTPGPCGAKISAKIDAIIKRNPSFNIMLKIPDVLSGKAAEAPFEIQLSLCSKFKYAPITSCDVERSFSAYKQILTDKRSQFTVNNLEKVIVIYCKCNYN